MSSTIKPTTRHRDLRVEMRLIADLKPHERNPRTHSKCQIKQIADSIKAFGFTNPVLIDEADGIIAGHGRVAAATLLGLAQVPTIRLSALSEAQKRAYIIADNKLALNAGWDEGLLRLELGYIADLDVDFDLTLTGFGAAEIDLMLDAEAADPKADAIPEADPATPPVSRLGDLWELGPHRLYCGDATKAESFEVLLAGRRAQMVFIDAPYNVRINGHVCGLGKIKHAEFAMASGEMTAAEFTAFLTTVLGHLARNSVNGSIHYVAMDWGHIAALLAAGAVAYTALKNICIWTKNNGGMGTFYRSQYEMFAVFKSGTAAHINNFELGQHGRYRTNVWSYPGVNTFKAGRLDELAMHPTVKPVALVADAIKDCSKRGGLILDCFVGSGTTIIAAHMTGRKACAMELDPKYVDVAIRRWETFTGLQARHAETGQTFDEVQAVRTRAEEAA